MYGRIARAPDNDPLRPLTFCPGSRRPATDRFVRRVGRPKIEWAKQMEDMAVRISGNTEHLESMIGNAASWTAAVKEHY